MTITALLVGAATAYAVLWVLWVCKRRRPATPQEFRRQWQNHRREIRVKDRPDYIKRRIAATKRHE